MNVPTVGWDELPADAFVLDVREPHEWQDGHLDTAVHVPMNSVPSTVAYDSERIPADERVYVNRTKDEIKRAPEFDEDRFDQAYRDDLGSYYGQGGPAYREPSVR